MYGFLETQTMRRQEQGKISANDAAQTGKDNRQATTDDHDDKENNCGERNNGGLKKKLTKLRDADHVGNEKDKLDDDVRSDVDGCFIQRRLGRYNFFHPFESLFVKYDLF